MQKDNKYNLKHAINLRKYERAVASIFDKMVEEAAALGVATGWDESKGSFSFDRFPKARKKFTDLMWRVRKDLRETIEKGMAQEWELSELKNTDILRALVASINATRKDEDKINEETLKSLEPRRADGLAGFQGRKVRGLGLSDRVWNVTSMASGQIELAIEQNLEKGKPAQKLSQDVRQALKEPDMMYRRYHKKITQADGTKKDVRVWYRKRVDDEGNVHFVEETLEAVGTGVYRSAYKNAMRLARTETNMAYQKADSNYYNRSKFVLGIRVILSNNHTTKIGEGNKTVPLIDICDELQGDYPTEFEFTGWHPQCRCTTIPIMPSKAEMMDYLKRKAKGEDVSNYPFSGKVDKLPANFIEWASNNEDRLIRMQRKGTLPYFIRENIAEGFRFGYGIDLKDGVKWSGKEFDYNEEHDVLSMSEKVVEKPKSRKEIIEEIAAKRHAARTEDKERELTEFWEKKKAEGEIRRRRERWDAAAKKRHEERTEEQINRILAERKARTDNYDIWEKNIKDAEARAQKNSWLTDEEKVLWIEGKTQAHLDLHSLEADALVQRMDVIDLMRPEWNRAALHTSEFDIYKDTLDEARRMISGGFKQKAIDSLTLLNSIEKIEPRYVDMRTYQKARPGKGGNKSKIEIALDEAEELIKNGDIKGAEAKIAEAEKTRKINEASNAAKAEARRKKAEEEAKKKAEEEAKKDKKLTHEKCQTIDDYRQLYGDDMPVISQNLDKSVQRDNWTDQQYLDNRDEIESKLKEFWKEVDFSHCTSPMALEGYFKDGILTNLQRDGDFNTGYAGERRWYGHFAFDLEGHDGTGGDGHYTKHIPKKYHLKPGEYYRCGVPCSKDPYEAFVRDNSGYGDAQLVFRRDRIITTFTMGNSLSQNTIPSLTTDPKVCSLDDKTVRHINSKKYTIENLREGYGYVEVQYLPRKSQGNFTPRDFKRITLKKHPEDYLPETVWQKWANEGVDIFYIDKKAGKAILYKKGKPLMTAEEAKKQLEGMQTELDNMFNNEATLSNKDVSIKAIQESIKNGDYLNAYEELEKYKSIEERKKKLLGLIPDADKWHKQFTIEELEGAHKAIVAKLDYMDNTFKARNTPDEVLNKWKEEIDKAEHPEKYKTGAKRFSTWEVSQRAYKRRYNELVYEYHKPKIESDLSSLRGFLTKDKAFSAKLADIEAKAKSGEWADVEMLINDAQNIMKNLGVKIIKLGDSTEIKFSAAEFTQAKRDLAKWFKDENDWQKAYNDADRYMQQYTREMWKNLSEEEKLVLWCYSDGSQYINKEILGEYQMYYVDPNGRRRNGLEDANTLTSIIEKAPALKEAMWMQSGKSQKAFEAIFDVDISNVSDLQSLVGREGYNSLFSSCHSAANGYFVKGGNTGVDNSVVLSIYMPKGTKGAYMEPFASYGDSLRWKDGLKYKGGVVKEDASNQVEFLLQRGAKFKITKAYKKGGKWYVDVDLIEQTAVEALDTTMKNTLYRSDRPQRKPTLM